jgi:uncharacterized membrane protein
MKALKAFLQGKWLGHPLHPALVHIPTALWPAALFFDVLGVLGLGGEATRLLSFYAIALGLVVALLAVPAGLADWSDIKPSNPARRLGLYHLTLNLTVWALFALNLWLRAEPPAEAAGGVGTLPLALSALGNLLLLISGYLGGRMAYGYGIGVARLSKKRWRRMAEAGGANLAPEQAKAEEGD